MFSPLSTPESVSRETVVTGTMFVPTRVAKLVLPMPSVTVRAAPRVPTSPVKRSFALEVVIPLIELWLPVGKVKRTVPARRWVIGPRFKTMLRPPARFRPELVWVAFVLRVKSVPFGLMLTMKEFGGMPVPVTGWPTVKPAVLVTVTVGELRAVLAPAMTTEGAAEKRSMDE